MKRNGTRTNILLLELTSQVTLDEGGLASATVADQDELESGDVASSSGRRRSGRSNRGGSGLAEHELSFLQRECEALGVMEKNSISDETRRIAHAFKCAARGVSFAPSSCGRLRAARTRATKSAASASRQTSDRRIRRSQEKPRRVQESNTC